jgi:hypothetical protein
MTGNITHAGLAEEFAERGYVIVRDVLDDDEVRQARTLCDQCLSGPGVQELMTSDFLADEFLTGIVLRDRVVEAVRQLVGQRMVLYPNCTARKNVYVPWHVDTTFTGPGTQYAWEPGFAHVQAGLYLQDNDPIAGGGIDVIRGSHLMTFDGYGTILADFSIAPRTLGTSCMREIVDTRAGDVVLWHARLMHASTPVQQASTEDKLGIFFSYGRENLRDNHRFLCQIAGESVRTMNGVSQAVPRLAEISHFRYPEGFPQHFVKSVEAAGIKVATL